MKYRVIHDPIDEKYKVEYKCGFFGTWHYKTSVCYDENRPKDIACLRAISIAKQLEKDKVIWQSK